MKIIKSFLLVTICLSATNLLLAQEIKTDVQKRTEVKAPAAANNKPSPAPELKPMNGVAATEAPVKASGTPSALKKDANQKQMEEPKLQVLTADANAATNKLTAEQLKTHNGTSERSKQIAPVAAGDAQNAKPQIIIAPAPVKEQ